MSPRVFKQKGSRVYRGRYRLGNNPKLFDVPLHTEIKHVAEAKLRQLVREQQEELAGLLPSKSIRDAAQKPLAEHLKDYVADLTARCRSKKHVAVARNRIARLCAQCGWIRLSDVSSDSFNRWRVKQSHSPKTLNEYLTLTLAFLAWLESNGQAAHNPLRHAAKAETKGKERRLRRALTQHEVDLLIGRSGPRRLAYLLAIYTGLRRGEIKQLSWADVHLEAPKPYLEVRASTTKNGKSAILPLLPLLEQTLRDHFKTKHAHCSKVFRLGVPSAKRLAEDLKACGIPVVDSIGRRVDFHALRHTFGTLLNKAGIPPRVVMELMRHSDMRLTHKTYTDATSLSLFNELEKLPAPSPLASPSSPKASLKSVPACPEAGKAGQSGNGSTASKLVPFEEHSPILAAAVPDYPNPKMAEGVGFEPTVPFRARLISSQVR